MFQKYAIHINDGVCTIEHPRASEKVSSIRQLDVQTKESSTNKWGDFDIQAEMKKFPDNLFVECLAIKADETNDNGDWFGEDQLKKYYHTFIGVPVFVNHQNNDIEQARGKVIHAWYDDAKHGIMIISRVDAVAYPDLARAITQKIINGTSMGTQVEQSVCSICHNSAARPTDYCSHIKEQKGKKISGTFACEYHKRGTEEFCPICGSTKEDVKQLVCANSEVHEKNYGLRFIENSFVVRPACHECGITEVIDPDTLMKKVADITEPIRAFIKYQKENDYKYAGKKELDDLNAAVDLIAGVSTQLIAQRNQVDQEFTSDLVKVMADLKEVADELGQMGYGRLQTTDEAAVPGAAPTEIPPPTGAPDALAAQPPTTTPEALNPLPGGASKVQSGSAGQVGTVTSPFTASLVKRLEKLSSTKLFH